MKSYDEFVTFVIDEDVELWVDEAGFFIWCAGVITPISNDYALACIEEFGGKD